MSLFYRVLQRTETGAKVIAEVQEDGTVTGDEAEFIREMIHQYGFPDAPLEEALYRFRFTARIMIGIERLDPAKDRQ